MDRRMNLPARSGLPFITFLLSVLAAAAQVCAGVGVPESGTARVAPQSDVACAARAEPAAAVPPSAS